MDTKKQILKDTFDRLALLVAGAAGAFEVRSGISAEDHAAYAMVVGTDLFERIAKEEMKADEKLAANYHAVLDAKTRVVVCQYWDLIDREAGKAVPDGCSLHTTMKERDRYVRDTLHVPNTVVRTFEPVDVSGQLMSRVFTKGSIRLVQAQMSMMNLGAEDSVSL